MSSYVSSWHSNKTSDLPLNTSTYVAVAEVTYPWFETAALVRLNWCFIGLKLKHKEPPARHQPSSAKPNYNDAMSAVIISG